MLMSDSKSWYLSSLGTQHKRERRWQEHSQKKKLFKMILLLPQYLLVRIPRYLGTYRSYFALAYVIPPMFSRLRLIVPDQSSFTNFCLRTSKLTPFV